MTTLWVTGGTGLLGAACVHEAINRGFHVLATHERHDPHVQHERLTWLRVHHADVAVVAGLLARTPGDAVIHTAAMAVPLEAQKAPQVARTLNTELPREVARVCTDAGMRMVHVSTDLVFDGQRGDYREDDLANPISVYGQTKLDAERTVAETCLNHVVARTALLLGPSPRGDRGVEEQLAAAIRRGETPTLFTNEFRTPVAAACLARMLVDLAFHAYRGVLHTTGAEVFSRHELGVRLMTGLGMEPRFRAVRLEDVPPVVPPRARNTTLNTARLQSLGITQPMALAQVLLAHPLRATTPS